MQASYASGYALGLPHRMLGTQKGMKTIQYGFACLMRTLSKATEARSAVVAGQTEGRMACQAHAASLLYVHPHPTAARRAATLASSGCEMHISARTSLRPLQRRFKARKKPEEYTSTPTGLKRLKTQITASYFSVSSSPMSPKCLNASRIASRFSGGHFGCFLSPDLSACVSSPHSAFICATYRELTFMPCVFWT